METLFIYFINYLVRSYKHNQDDHVKTNSLEHKSILLQRRTFQHYFNRVPISTLSKKSATERGNLKNCSAGKIDLRSPAILEHP